MLYLFNLNLYLMSENSDKLKHLLKPFGLKTEESLIYLLLLEKGELTALNASRYSKISRTKVYRILDRLLSIGLVNERVDEMGSKFIANSPDELELLLIKKENEVRLLKESFQFIKSQLSSINPEKQSKTKVLYYRGVDGLEQVSWNSLKANAILRTYEIKDMNVFLDYGFNEKMREEIVKRNILIETISNQTWIDGWTNVVDVATKHWQIRYIDPYLLTMKQEILIYNDVYAMYNYEGDDVFCVEIYNEKLADMQKQIFDILWATAQELTILDNHGTAKLR